MELAIRSNISTVSAGPWGAVTYHKWTGSSYEGAKGDFISDYAKMNAYENYAESFKYGITGGAENPCEYDKDTQIYKCCKAVFDNIVAFAGYNSNATKRMAGYLGIDISDKLAA
jgi:hypothetical protein